MITTVFKVANEIGKIVYNSEINKTGYGITKKIDNTITNKISESTSIDVNEWGVSPVYRIIIKYIQLRDKKEIYKKYIDIANTKSYTLFKPNSNFNIWLDKFTYINISYKPKGQDDKNLILLLLIYQIMMIQECYLH